MRFLFPFLGLLLTIFHAAAQEWSPDEAFGSDGVQTILAEEWATPVAATSFGNGWAVALETYAETGEVWTDLCHLQSGTAPTCFTLPDSNLRVISLSEFPGGDWICIAGTTYEVVDSLGLTARVAVEARDASGTAWSGFGTDGRLDIEILSVYQELHGAHWDEMNGEDVLLLSGMSLDPCCIHQEVPFVAAVDLWGDPVAGFGHNGRIAIDLPNGDTYDEDQYRHDVGGALYQTRVSQDGHLFACGAFSNTEHYEPLALQLNPDGTLDTAFANGGAYHINASPGDQHWAMHAHEFPPNRWTLLIDHHANGNLEASPQRLVLASQGAEQFWNESSCLGADWMPVHAFSSDSIQFALGSSASGNVFVQSWNASQNTGIDCSELWSEVAFGDDPVAANDPISQKIAVATRGIPVTNNSIYSTLFHVFNQNINSHTSNELKPTTRNCGNLTQKLTLSTHLDPDVFDLCGRPVTNMFSQGHLTDIQISEYERIKVHIVVFQDVGFACPILVIN